jgi:phosphoenolpyruvate synthase/pyruvate phosphate dikinase
MKNKIHMMKTRNIRPSVIRWFSDLSNDDVPFVGGKNASLGEMVRTMRKQNIWVPDGFAITAEAYWQFLETNRLNDKIAGLVEDMRKNRIQLGEAGYKIRQLISKAEQVATSVKELRAFVLEDAEILQLARWACEIESPEHLNDFKDGDILVTRMTDPDWVPIMRQVAGIITERGGRRIERHGRTRPGAWQGRSRNLCHVRDSLECHPGREIQRALRRLLHRQQRSRPTGFEFP